MPRGKGDPPEPVAPDELQTDPGEDDAAAEGSVAPTEVIGGPDVEHALVQQFRLMGVEGRDEAANFMSTRDRAVIGTHPKCDLVLTDRAVSRFHCEVSLVDGRAVLRDLG